MSSARSEFRTTPSSITPLAVAPEAASQLLDISASRVYALMRAGELLSYRCGRSRRIPMESIRGYIERRLADSAVTGWRTWQHNPVARRQRQERA